MSTIFPSGEIREDCMEEVASGWTYGTSRGSIWEMERNILGEELLEQGLGGGNLKVCLCHTRRQ